MKPDGVFLSNGPGDPAEVGYAVDAIARAAGQGAGVRHLPGSPTARPGDRRARRSSCRSVITAATTRCAHESTGHVEITSQNHNFCVDPDSLAARSPKYPPQPERRHVEGLRVARCAGVQRAVPPRGRARPARQPLPVRRLRHDDGRPTAGDKLPIGAQGTGSTGLPEPLIEPGWVWPDAQAHRHPLDPHHRLGADRHRPGVRVRLLRHAGVPRAQGRGLPGHPGQLEPGHDHDRPRLRRRHVRRADHLGGRRQDHRAGAARRGAAHASAARPG